MINNDSLSKLCTVVCCSCDKYADLQPVFLELFRKYWPDCPFSLVLVTETDLIARLATPADPKNPTDPNSFSQVFALGAGKNWASRLVEALDKIETPYVLMLCDDYFLERKVDTAKMISRLEEMRRRNAANLRLIPNPVGGKAVEGSDLLEYERNTAYCIATQAGFWEKGFLKSLAAPVASIWEFERYGSFAVGGEQRPLLHTATKEFPFVDAVHKGHWEKFGVRVCRENGIAIDFAKRGLPPLKARLVEGLKGLIFAIVPTTWLVRLQNRFGLGAKEVAKPEGLSFQVVAGRVPGSPEGLSSQVVADRAPGSHEGLSSQVVSREGGGVACST